MTFGLEVRTDLHLSYEAQKLPLLTTPLPQHKKYKYSIILFFSRKKECKYTKCAVIVANLTFWKCLLIIQKNLSRFRQQNMDYIKNVILIHPRAHVLFNNSMVYDNLSSDEIYLKFILNPLY